MERGSLEGSSDGRGSAPMQTKEEEEPVEREASVSASAIGTPAAMCPYIATINA